MFAMRRNQYAPLEKALGYSFRRKSLLEGALLHRSFRYETKGIEDDNQRMEFLGDAALSLVSAAHVYRRFADMDEGALTCVRSLITSGKALARIGQAVRLGDAIKVGKGEAQTGGREKASNIADAMEAVIGAAYLDGGIRAVERIFKKLFVSELDAAVEGMSMENPKGELQRVCHRNCGAEPHYKTLTEEGPAHQRQFTVAVFVGGKQIGCGCGSSKRTAEAAAARDALRNMASVAHGQGGDACPKPVRPRA